MHDSPPGKVLKSIFPERIVPSSVKLEMRELHTYQKKVALTAAVMQTTVSPKQMTF